MATDSPPAYTSFRYSDLGFAYNEAAFRHFLTLEWRRAARSMRPLGLILITNRATSGSRLQLEPQQAAQVFNVLGASLREVDFVGWYREGSVAAAVVPLTSAAGADVTAHLHSRVSTGLSRATKTPLAHLRVRVVRLGGKVRH